jgi:hypothetical protein
MSWISSALDAAAALGSAYIGSRSQHSANVANRDIAQMTNVANARQAAAVMSFQERMSNTAYQRQMSDLRAAGINPMLVSQLGGSSSPPGASIPAVTGVPMQPDVIGASTGLNSAVNAIRTRYDIENLRETNRKIKSDTSLNKALQQSATADAAVKAANAKLLQYSLPAAAVKSIPYAVAASTVRSLFGSLRQFGR